MLAGCASNFDALPEKFGGLPEGAPARPAEAAPFPNVYEPMEPHAVKKLTEGERKNAEQELLALRDRQHQRAGAATPAPQAAAPPPKARPRKEARKKPAGTKAAERRPPDKQAN